MPGRVGEGRLKALRQAHRFKRKGYTSRAEDYVELIYELIKEKGYARMADISENLYVRSPTVTKMLKRLAEEGLIHYERYRGIRLTEKGEDLAKALRERHDILVRFFEALGVSSETAHKTAEGVEHYLPHEVIEKLEALVKALERNPEVLRASTS